MTAGGVVGGALGGVRGFADQHRTSLRVGIAAVIIAGIIAFLLMHTASQPPRHQAPVITMVVIQPPKPPPPPPPLPQPKMITPPKMTTPVLKPLIPNAPPKPAPPRPAAPAVTPMGTSIHNNGPADNFNLNGTPGGDGFLGGAGGGGGSAEGYFQSVVSAQIRDALAANPATRNASAGLQVYLWVDPSGLVTRVALKKTSGDPAVDSAITNQVLNNMQLRQPPPAGDPMPISISLVGEAPLQ